MKLYIISVVLMLLTLACSSQLFKRNIERKEMAFEFAVIIENLQDYVRQQSRRDQDVFHSTKKNGVERYILYSVAIWDSNIEWVEYVTKEGSGLGRLTMTDFDGNIFKYYLTSDNQFYAEASVNIGFGYYLVSELSNKAGYYEIFLVANEGIYLMSGDWSEKYLKKSEPADKSAFLLGELNALLRQWKDSQ